MATPRAPKQRQLTTEETVNTFESWKQYLLYILSLDNNFALFLEEGCVWGKKTAANPNRGFQNDGQAVPEAERQTAAQKCHKLEMMLGQIANFCCVISRNSIVKQSTSLNDIWQKIRLHFGFQSTGAHFLDLSLIKMNTGEKPEDLYQRINAFFEDNLLTRGGGITHHGEVVHADEDMTPTLENTVVLLWLQLVHPGLPQLVKQKYGSELRNKSLASLKPEISQALSSLLDELHSLDESKAMRASSYDQPRQRPDRRSSTKQLKSCVLCRTAGRPSYNTHYLSECRFLPEADRRRFTRSRMVDVTDDFNDMELDQDGLNCDNDQSDVPVGLLDSPSVLRVNVIQSPFLHAYYNSQAVRLTLDTGATTNMIKLAFAQSLKMPIKSASQLARQADGITPLDVTGEVHCTLKRGDHTFVLDALVVKQLDVDILAGNPFLVSNDIATRPAKRQIVIGGSDIVHYGQQPHKDASVRLTQTYILHSPIKQTVLPGEYVKLHTPHESDSDITWAMEPRLDCSINSGCEISKAWPEAQEVTSVGHSVQIMNTTSEPILLKRNEHFCQVRAVCPVDSLTAPLSPARSAPNATLKTPQPRSGPYSSQVVVDPNNSLPEEIQQKIVEINTQYDDVFNPKVHKYNGASGKVEAVVNIGPTLPPQRKGRIPQYNRATLSELQDKFDSLEAEGVFAKPEQVNVDVEYLNVSFLVRKPNGGSRLVTSFGEVAKYCKPQPSLMPNVDSVLRDIARWNYIIVTDLNQAFYQIPLAVKSMKYCGVVTPYKGVRVYTRSAMGMPGSETCLEEILSRILGDLIQEGCVAKIADDMYIGGDTVVETLNNWVRVLKACALNNIGLSAIKTVMFPLTTVILGWVWSCGTLSASPHKLAALAAVEPPQTVQAMRSFTGAYKVLSRVLKGYADLLDPLDVATAGRESREKITWSDELLAAFTQAQSALNNVKTITMPRPTDLLWIVTDAALRNRGIAATLYAVREGRLVLCGFFNAKLRQHQVAWLPCEVEALCIGAAVRHFAPYITQSHHTAQVLTDSRPCVQAYEKLQRGEYSNSSRVTTFLSIISRYGVQVRHIAGVSNLPSDFASRNALSCIDQSCQVCKFISELEDSVVRHLTVKEVIEGSTKMPFTSRAAWSATQQECPDLRRTHSHLTQGTRPSKKATKIPDVKRYLKMSLLPMMV